ncbi:ATP-binding protein [Simiduia sp. 21SJ11W-1]|uniref:ATP-binding protein n=1 Tax=Simiduia sp. 21SJ11W-1 TaxID=2909669 RepID=UPI00209DD637|nr:ATP-binding protein [Simiduia sp. 21SJ11W-1]UTA47321.1 ATP-binding protein [Simiduia sp. 21SJ11W-1]
MNHHNNDLQPTNSIRHNLNTLVVLRWWLLGVLSLSTLLAYQLLHLSLNYTVLAQIIVGFALLNGLTHWRLRKSHPVTLAELMAQLCVDIVGISLLLYFTGGATNPFVSYLLIPICIGAMTLPRLLTAATAALAILSYWWLLGQYIPVDSLAPHHHHGQGNSLHIYGMWLNFILSAVIISAFVSRIAYQLRLQQQLLQAQREQVLHAEQLTTIATLTAGTAHELSTPLGSIKIAIDELQQAELPEDLQPEVATIAQQINLCQATLARLRETAGSTERLAPKPYNAQRWLHETLAQWALINPRAQLQSDITAVDSQVQLYQDPTLAQSLINLLSNAAQHSQSHVGLYAKSDSERQCLQIDIQDDGPALDDTVRARWGQPFNSARNGGLGLGVFLSNSTIERHGGKLQLIDTEQGKITRIILLLVNTPGDNPKQLSPKTA